MNRRQFCVGTSQALTLAAVTGVLPGCGGNPMDADDIDQSDTQPLPQVSAQIVNNTISLNVASIPSLSAVGGSVLVIAPQTPILVSRTGQDQFTALTAVCTHEGCTVERFTGQTYFCPCHGSAYTQTGSVVQGPASRSLATKASTFSGGTLTITV